MDPWSLALELKLVLQMSSFADLEVVSIFRREKFGSAASPVQFFKTVVSIFRARVSTTIKAFVLVHSRSRSSPQASFGSEVVGTHKPLKTQ